MNFGGFLLVFCGLIVLVAAVGMCANVKRVGRVESISAPLRQLSTQKGQRITPTDLVYNNN
jgi:hypothetical protein